MEKTIKIRGEMKIINAKTREVLRENHNMFVASGLAEIAKWIGSDNTAVVPSHIAVGTSSTAPASAQTALVGTELGRKAISTTTVNDNSVTYVAIFNEGEATGVWEETGVFSAASAGTMFSRAVTGTYTKGALDKIEVHWTYTFTDGG